MSTLDQAPDCAAAGRAKLFSKFSLSALADRVGAMLRSLSSRRAVSGLRELDDTQLADIGLQRRDVDVALSLPFGADPSHHLIRARQNPLRGTRRF